MMERYKQLVEELYIKSKEEQILGSFLEFDHDRQEFCFVCLFNLFNVGVVICKV